MGKNCLKMKFNSFFKVLILLTLFACVITGFCFLYENNEAYAEDGVQALALVGSGTSDDPYLIREESDLIYMKTQCNNEVEGFQTAYYKQVDHITLTSTWTKLMSFSGNYDGQGYTISGLTNTSIDYAFFQVLEKDSVVKNLGFTNVKYTIDTDDKCDIAVMAIHSYGEISNCFVSGRFDVKVRKDQNHLYSAGLVVYMRGGTIKNCYNDLDIIVDSPGVWVSYMNVGGIGTEIYGGTIENCYSIGKLEIDYCLYWKIGGIVAKDGGGGYLKNCGILQNSCVVDGKSKNSTITYSAGSESVDRENTGIVSESVLKGVTESPTKYWEFNASNESPRVWGFVSDTTNEYYNNGFPQLRVFYEYFLLDVYTENGSSLITSKVTRYPDYSFDLSDIVAPTKKGHTFNGEFTLEKNSVGTRYSGVVPGIYANYVVYAAYDINYYRLYVKNSNPKASGLVERDERIAYDSVVTIDLQGVTPGYRFVAWKDINTHEILSDQLTPTFNMPDYDIEVYPEFVEYTYFVKVNINNNSLGSVSGAYDYYYAGDEVTLTAYPKDGYKVDKFYLDDGTVLGTGETYTFTMTNTNMNINVDFVPKSYSLTVKSYPENLVTVSGGGQYYKGDMVELSFANIPSGYTFAGWKLDNIESKSLYADREVVHEKSSTNEIIYCYFISEDNYIAFVNDNKVISEHVVTSGSNITPPVNPTKDGYKFVGWYTQKENGSKITSFDNITYSFNAYARYEKVFDCQVEFSLRLSDSSLKIKDNTLVFVALKTTNTIYNISLNQYSPTIFNLVDLGNYSIDYVLPTHFAVDIYKDGEEIENSFDVTLDDRSIRIQFILTYVLDKWLYDSSNHYDDVTIEDIIVVDPIIEIGNEDVYVGVDSAITDFNFNSMESDNVPVSPYGYDLKDVIGATNWGGLYNFTELDYLNEGANFVAKDLGSSVYKVTLANNYREMYPFNSNWGTNSINNMTDLAKSPAYIELFSNPDIKTYIIVAYEFVYCPWERVITAKYNLDDLSIYYEYVKNEFANLTKHLLTTYVGKEKTFILSNWEGDNAYGAYFDMCTTDEERQLLTDAYVGYINARQDGIKLGKQGLLTTTSSVKVYGNFEINHIGQDIPNVPNRWRLVDVAIPYTYCDLYSFSDWYSYLQDKNGNYLFPLEELLDELYNAVQTNLTYKNPSEYPPNTNFNNKKNIMITEFGYDENTDSQFFERLTHEIETAVEWGVYKLVYWGVYSNVRLVAGTERPKNEEVQGLWLIKPDGTLSDAFWYIKSLITKLDYVTQTPKIVFDVIESGFDWLTYSNSIIFKDDLIDDSKLLTYSQDLISFYSIDEDSENYFYFEEFDSHYGEIDNTGVIQNNLNSGLSYLTYAMKSNKFGILLYNYNSYFGYQDLDGNNLDGLIKIEGKTKLNDWEEIKGLKIEQIQSSRADGNLYWFQTCITGIVPVGKFSELRISFVNKNYNAWDPIITSVVFFEGGQA